MRPAPLRLVAKTLLLLALGLALLGCETEKVQQTQSGIQQNLFLQALALVENGGGLLQTANPEPAAIDRAMQQMDQGLAQAYQVDASFLEQLDIRLPKHFSESFIAGVENYRLGVESSNRDQQLLGLDRLARWADFWSKEKSGILLKMTKITGLPLQDSEDYRQAAKQFKQNQSTTEVSY